MSFVYSADARAVACPVGTRLIAVRSYPGEMMGVLLSLECAHCDFSVSSLLGGGFASAEKEPASCARCRTIVTVGGGGPAMCPQCHQPATKLADIAVGPDARIVAEWYPTRLREGPYPCPSCNRSTLFLANVGDWD